MVKYKIMENNIDYADSCKQSNEEKRILSLKKSWKNRKDYIGDLVEKNPYIYNSWRYFKFTQKGKKIGNSIEWNDFRTFYNDVIDTYQNGFLFRRKDFSLPFSKENFIWVSKEESKKYHSNIILIECDGETHSIDEWSKILNKSKTSIQQRYHKHKNEWSNKEILYGKEKKRNDKKPTDWKYSKEKIRAKASKMISSYKFKDKKNNFDEICDIFIENILTKKCVYCGDSEKLGADRINNDKGHIISNIVPCCYECNCARNNNFSHDEMLILGKTINEIKSKRKPKNEIILHNINECLNFQKRTYNSMVYQFDKDKNLIMVYDNIDQASTITNFKRSNILLACTKNRHNTNKYKGFYWSYNDSLDDSDVEDFSSAYFGKVYQYDLDGNLIKVYNSLNEVSKYGFTKSSVQKCCTNKRTKHKNFIWKY